MPTTEQSQAVLLIGPTGSGKSPLGDHLAEHGLWGRTCHHFDFGANLRAAARGDRPGFERHEALFFQNALSEGTLLEGPMFYLAEKVWRAFRAEAQLDDSDLVIMNGLPRHLEQAQDAEKLVDIVKVIHLDCSKATALKRLDTDAGSDGEERADDEERELVEKQIETYEKRTKPLVDHYAKRDVPVVEVKIKADTKPEDLVAKIGEAPANLREMAEVEA